MRKIKEYLALLVLIIGILLGLYVGGYLCFFKGIVLIVEGIKGGWIATKIAWGVVRIVIASTVGIGVAIVIGFLGYIIIK